MPAPPFRGGILRKYYIDNLRTLCILLLFPYHTCMIYNSFESFYVHGPVVQPLSDFVFFCSPWFMPLMFVLAGISARFALKKRTAREFIKERFLRLFIPLVFGILLLVPAQTYFAERFHNGYTGGYFEQYLLFFTKSTDLTGYKGGFTPAHLWFILYLFVISLIALPVMLWYNNRRAAIIPAYVNAPPAAMGDYAASPRLLRHNKREKGINASRLTIPILLSLVVVPYVMSAILDLSGKSFGQSLALFMLGYLILSEDEVVGRLEKYRWPLTASGAVLLILLYAVFRQGLWLEGFSPLALLFSLGRHLVMWVCILALLGLGRHCINGQSKFAAYFAKASFPLYLFHQTWVIAAGSVVLAVTDIVALEVPLIIAASFLLSMLTYELTKRLAVTRFIFGIKYITKAKEEVKA